MASVHPGVTGRKIANRIEPLAVSPREACILLGIGNTRLYQLIGTGELESYREGSARRLTMEGIRRRVEKKIAEAKTPRLLRRARKNARLTADENGSR